MAYKGTIREKGAYNARLDKQYKIIAPTEVEHNGIIAEQYKITTIEAIAPKNVSYRDFDIRNLMQSGAIGELKPTQLTTPIEKVARQAEIAQTMLDTLKTMNNEQTTES